MITTQCDSGLCAKRMRVRLLATAVASLALFALATPSRAEYYAFSGPGGASPAGSDMVYQENLWPYWAETTYYARWSTNITGPTNSAYFYSGPAQAIGAQTTGSLLTSFLQSFWPPANGTLTVVPEWWWPIGLKNEPAIGEGASGKVDGDLPPITTGVWYPTVERIWQPTDTNQSGDSKVAQWCKDGVTGQWYHFATFNVPFVATGMDSIGGFLEDYSNGNSQPRREDWRKLYYRLNGVWNPAVTFQPSMRQTGEKGYSGLEANNSACFFETCSGASYTGNMAYGGANSNPTYTLTEPSTPTFDSPGVTGVSATIAAGQLNVSWSVPSTVAPQFSYTIKVYPTSNTSGSPSQTITEINPDACSKTIVTSLTTPTVVLTINDIFDQTASPVTVTAQSSSALPPIAPDLLTQDIGSVGISGNDVSLSGGGCTITGSGADIWGTADSFRFAYQQMNGNGQITARVLTQDSNDPWAKAGVMIRDGLTAGGAHASIFTTPGNGVNFQYRTVDGGASSSVAGTAGTLPYIWLSIARSGNTFTASTSPDGNTWTPVGSTTISMGATVYVGLAVTAHNNSETSSATFRPVVVAPLPASYSGVYAFEDILGYALDDPNGGGVGTGVNQLTYSGANQNWTVTQVSGSEYKIAAANGSVLSGPNTNSGLQLQAYTGALDQLWQISPLSSGGYLVTNVGTGQAMDDFNGGSGQTVGQWSSSGGGNLNQVWQMTSVSPLTVPNGVYELVNTSNLSLDDPNGGGVGTTPDQQPISYSNTNDMWTITQVSGSEYKIVASNGSALSGSTASAPLVLQTYTGASNQLWQFYPLVAGGYSVINVGTGQPMNENGGIQGVSVVQGWATNVQWQLIVPNGTYTLTPACAPGAVLDAAGWTDSLDIWGGNNGANQKWVVTNVGGTWYTIQPSFNSTLGVQATGTTNGTSVDLATITPWAQNELWSITSVPGGFELAPASAPWEALDVAGNGTAWGTPIQLQQWLNQTGSIWAFTPV